MAPSRSILFLSPNLAMPDQHGGCVYPHALLRALHRAGRPIHYGWTGAPLGEGRRAMRDPLRAPYVARGFVRGTARLGPIRLAATLRGWLGRRPHNGTVAPADSEHLATPAEQQFAASVITRTRPAAVLIDGTASLTLLDGLPAGLRAAIRVYVLTHNLTHRRTELYRAAGQALDFLPMTADDERSLLRRADTIIAIQDREADAFRALLPGKRVITVPVPFEPQPLPEPAPAPARCLFVGGYSGHNIIALRRLVSAIWPLVRAARPDAELLVAGTVGRALSAALPGVRLLGPVADLRTAYADAHVCLVPLALGTGLKVKLVEAMSHGRPAVTTAAGAEGFAAVEAGSVAVVADDDAAFARATVDLLNSPAERRRVATAQLDWVRTHLAGAAAIQPLLDALDTGRNRRR